MKIAIVGSRTWSDKITVENYVNTLPNDAVIISGGARGVDTMAEQAALKRGLLTHIIKPDWAKHGKAAGILRNTDIVAEADEVIAFWDGQSNGTLDTITKALRAANVKKVTVIKGKGEENNA